MNHIKDKTGTKFIDKVEITLRQLLTLLDEWDTFEVYGNKDYDDYISYGVIYNGKLKYIVDLPDEFLDSKVDKIDTYDEIIYLERDEDAIDEN